VPSSAIRLVAIASAAALVGVLAGAALEVRRFGTSADAAAAHLEANVRARFAERARHVEELAKQTARETPAAVAAAVARSDDAPALFDRLMVLARATTAESISATIYVPTGVANQYRVLAWSEGPAENVGGDRLGGPPALFLARGTLGLRLVYVQPIASGATRLGVVAAETVLAPAVGVGPSQESYRLDTAFGPVSAVMTFAGATLESRPLSRFVITPQGGGTALEVRFAPEDLHSARMLFRYRAAAIAALPLLIALLLLTGRALRRRAGSPRLRDFLLWTAVAGVTVAATTVVFLALVPLLGLSDEWRPAITGLSALGLVALLPMSWWWRRPHRLRPRKTPAIFVLEQLATGVAVGLLLWLLARLLHDRINAATLAQWQLPLFPLQLGGPLYLAGLILAEIAIYWALAMLLALMAGRWRLSTKQARPALTAGLCWLAPTVVLIATGISPFPLPRAGLIGAGASAVVFALLAASFRHRYRRTTQAMRLVLLFAALFAPLVVLYPSAWFYADAVARSLIEHNYAPATMGRPRQILEELKQAQSEIDGIPAKQLIELVAQPVPRDAAIPTQFAFGVWNQTSLARTRTTSAIELYAADRSLASRFALNVPQYRAVRDMNLPSEAAGCGWNVFGEAVPFGAEERRMLHAERQLCDDEGRAQGAISVYVINDYQALPFVSYANPYSNVLRAPDAAAQGSLVTDLQVVVYGWSFSPLFTSTNVAWPITPELFARLYRSRQAFWTQLPSEDRLYNVYFANDSQSIYAIGYPTATVFQHLTRLAETATLTAAIFILLLMGAAVFAPFARRTTPPLATLFEEIRTSFYRKLFLFFVLAAIAPVLLFAVAFAAYMTDRFRADVENEAASVVTVARRVLEQSVAFGEHPGQLRTTLNDDVMVWIGQVLHQDVNLFEGPDLVATSQRDLFDSGLLPTRTPAAVYRAIALDRLPTAVAEDNLGTLHYLVAAAQVPAGGREVVLSVPLALRQREIEREIDELNRGVLVGAVFVILFAAGLGASVARRVSDPVARLSRATRQIAAGKLDVRIVADTADELRRLIDDFNSMAATLSAQRAELARTNQLKAWAEMARQVAHEIKNPLTPIQLAAEHVQHVHEDQHRPLGPVFDQCLTTILKQVRLLRQIAGEFANFAGEPTPRFGAVAPMDLIEDVLRPYQTGLSEPVAIERRLPDALPDIWIDRTLVARALTNLVENALQAMPGGGTLLVSAAAEDSPAGHVVRLTLTDTGVGMDAEAVDRAFEPYFSTKTAGSGLGLANAKRNIELCGGTITLTSAPGRGTTATVTLPVKAPGAPAPASTPSR
jgi:signal transduction histidine kinase